MTYRELLHKSARLFDRGKITVGEYEEMTKPLDRDIECLDKIRADIQELRNCSCSCSDGIIDDVEDIIDKYKAESEE